MPKYSAAFKEKVVREHQPGVRGKGFAALATRFKLKGANVIRKWWRKWHAGGRTVDALQEEVRGHRRSILTQREKERFILDYVSHKNAEGIAVDYKDVHKNVVKHTKKKISERAVREIGYEELNLTWKKVTKSLVSDGMSLLAFTYVSSYRI